MIFPQALGIPLLYLLAGLGLCELVPSLRARPLAARLGWAFLLGVAAVAGSLYTLSFLGVPLGAAAARTAFAVAVLMGLLARATRTVRKSPSDPSPSTGSHRSPRGPARLLLAALLGVAGLVAAGLFADALTNPILDWDGRMTWVAHARYVRAGRGVLAPAFTDPGSYVLCPRYPLLLPVALAAGQEALGASDDERVVRPFFAAFYPAFLLVVLEGASRVAGRVAAAGMTLAAALLPQVGFLREGGAASAYADLPLACFFGGALLLLLRARPGSGDALCAGLLLGAGILTKNEGIPLALIALAAAASVRAGRAGGAAGRRALAQAAAVSALALLLCLAWRSRVPLRLTANEEGFRAPLAALVTLVGRLPRLAGPIAREFLEMRVWGPFWPAFALVLALGARALATRRARPFVVAALLGFGVYLAAYGATEMKLPSLVMTTWSRFLLQLSLPLFALGAMALRRSVGSSGVRA